jgi:putative ABC transport system substrate-binding protein
MRRREVTAVPRANLPLQRRAFIALVGGAIASPFNAARAQQTPRMRRVAWLGLGGADASSPYVDELRAGLRELNWIEGRNLTLDLYWATGREDMEGAARELLASSPEVIVTQELMTMALQAVKTDKPVVFGFSGDPVDVKLVQSWARPGTNYTGMSYLALELVEKRIELLKEWLPQTRRVAILARPQHPGDHLERQATEAAVAKLDIQSSYFPYTAASLPARDFGQLETVFRAIVQDRCDALVVFPDSAMYEISDRIAKFAIEAKLPSVSGWTPFAHKGLLMTYGPNVRELYRSLAGYVDRILRGADPAELPVEIPSKFFLALNAVTAKSLGVTIPPSLLARADEVIE